MVSGIRLAILRERRRPRNAYSIRRRLLKGFKPLEQRSLLSVDGLTPQGLYDSASPLISPTWFADFSDALAPSHVNPATLTTDSAGKPSKMTDSVSIDGSEVARYDWIVQFDTLPLEGISSAADTASLLVGGGVQFEVLRGLGIVGQVLPRSSAASIETVGTWLASNDAVASYELNVVREYQVTPNDLNTWRLWGMHNTGQTGGRLNAFGTLTSMAAWQETFYHYQLPASNQHIDLNDYAIESYGDGLQDIEGTATIEDGGATLRLVGNNWKMIHLPVTVTPETVLEFDFRSSHQGEIQAIGFDIDDAISSDTTFQLYGAQSWSLQTFHDYGQSAPGDRHYVIPVGQYFTGQMQNLLFANDHDVVQPDSASVFSNVLVYDNASTAEMLAGKSVAARGGKALTITEESPDTSGSVAELAGVALDNTRSFCQDDVVVESRSVDLLCTNHDLELESPRTLLHATEPVLTIRSVTRSAPVSTDSIDAGSETLDRVFGDLDLGSFNEELVAELARAVA